MGYGWVGSCRENERGIQKGLEITTVEEGKDVPKPPRHYVLDTKRVFSGSRRYQTHYTLHVTNGICLTLEKLLTLNENRKTRGVSLIVLRLFIINRLFRSLVLDHVQTFPIESKIGKRRLVMRETG